MENRKSEMEGQSKLNKKFKRNQQWAKSIKVVVHELLFTISILLTCALFFIFSEKLAFIIIWVIFGFSLEGLKRYLTMVCKAKIVKREWKKFVGYFSVYLPIALISAVASLGFSLVTIHYQSIQLVVSSQIINTKNDKIIENYESQIERYEADITQYELQITDRENNIAYEKEQILQIDNRIEINNNKLSEISVWASETETRLNNVIKEDEELKIDKKELIRIYQEEIDNIYIDIEEAKDNIQEIKNNILNIETEQSLVDIEENSEIRSMDVFDMIGQRLWWKPDGIQVLFGLMLILVVILEVALFITTEELKEEEKIIEVPFTYPKMDAFLSALVDTTGKFKENPLNNKNYILAKTTIKKEDYDKYLNYLMNIVYKNTPLIYRNEKDNNLYSNYGKENLLSLVKNYRYFEESGK